MDDLSYAGSANPIPFSAPCGPVRTRYVRAPFPPRELCTVALDARSGGCGDGGDGGGGGGGGGGKSSSRRALLLFLSLSLSLFLSRAHLFPSAFVLVVTGKREKKRRKAKSRDSTKGI